MHISHSCFSAAEAVLGGAFEAPAAVTADAPRCAELVSGKTRQRKSRGIPREGDSCITHRGV